MENRITIYFDGACHNKVGVNSPMGIGIAVKVNKEYREDLSLFGHFWYEDESIRGTSNSSEWIGCKEALRLATILVPMFSNYKIHIFSDSQVISRQFNNEYTIKEEAHRKLYIEAHKYAAIVSIKEIKWIRREWNKEADVLSKRGRHDNSILNVIRPAI